MYYAWGRLFSRKILCKYGVRPPEGIVYGGDLIFCMEYIRACLAEGYKDYAVIQCPLYFYELGNSQSVTTRLRPTDCDDELVTTAYLLQGFAPPLTVPDEDFGRVLHNCMRTMAEGYAYVLYHEQGLNSAQRHAKIRRYLAHPAMLALLQAFGERKLYSPYYFWLRRGWYRPACFIARLKAESSRWYHRVYWAGWWLHTALHGKKEEIYL